MSLNLLPFDQLEIAIVGCVLHFTKPIDLVLVSQCVTIYNCEYKANIKTKKLILDERELIEPGDIITVIKKDICRRGLLLKTDKDFSQSIDMRIKGHTKLLRVKISDDNIYLTGGKSEDDLNLTVTLFDHMKWCSNCFEYIKRNYDIFSYFVNSLSEVDNKLITSLDIKDTILTEEVVNKKHCLVYLYDFLHEFTEKECFINYFNDLFTIPGCPIKEDVEFLKWNKSMQNYWFSIGPKLNRYKVQEIFNAHPKFNSTFETGLAPSCMIYYPYNNPEGKKNKVYSVAFTVKSTGMVSLSGQNDKASEEAYNLFCELIKNNNHIIRY